MGWDWVEGTNDTQPKIFNYWYNTYGTRPAGTYTYESPVFFNWGAWSVWRRQAVAIRYINDTGQPMMFGSISIKILACNSGGQGFNAHNGWIPAPGTNGYGANYTLRVRVCNTSGAADEPVESWHTLTYQETSITNHIPTDNYNMNYPGVAGGATAMFGEPPYSFPLREFAIENCPIIEPDGIALVQLEIKDRDGGEGRYDPTIRFALNPHEMVVNIEPLQKPYIWKSFIENGQVVWHLVKPVQIQTAGGWEDIEGNT